MPLNSLGKIFGLHHASKACSHNRQAHRYGTPSSEELREQKKPGIGVAKQSRNKTSFSGNPAKTGNATPPEYSTSDKDNHRVDTPSYTPVQTAQRHTGNSSSIPQAIRAIEKGDFEEFRRLVPGSVPFDSLSGQGRSLRAIAKFHQQREIFDYLNLHITTQVVRAIETGNLAEFQRLVPSRLPVDSVSSGGHSLRDIAKFHRSSKIVSYVDRQLTGRVIKAIEEGNLAEVQRLVPSSVCPSAISTQGRSLTGIAKYHHQPDIAQYLESLKTAKGEAVEFYEKGKPYYEFTNFYQGKPILIDGDLWPTTEHYFQAQKFVGKNISLQDQIRKQQTPRAAFNFARAHDAEKRSDWETVKDNVARKALKAKFTQDERLREILLSTGDAELVEASPTDSYWGYGSDKKGTNMLGKLLMELRTHMRSS
jgi:N-glycosidase YbiA